MKIVCIYHSIDLDGWMSAAIVKHYYKLNSKKYLEGDMEDIADNDSIAFIGYNYGQPIPNLSEYSKVIMCDISFPSEVMQQLVDRLNVNFIWIDHHISAINDNRYVGTYQKYPGFEGKMAIFGRRNVKYSACELTWKYFFEDKMPEIVRVLGRYDCFGHKGTDEEIYVLEFQYGARACISNYNDAYNYLYNCIMQFNIGSIEHSIWLNGKAIYRYLCTDAKQSYKNGFTIHFDEIVLDDNGFPNCRQRQKFICINKERFNPINFGIDYHADGYDGAACFHYADGKWKFSIYNDDGVADCSVIAKQFGGGGHKGAAGFIVDNDTFYKIINNV